MKHRNILYRITGLVFLLTLLNCADNTFDEQPLDDNFPFQLVMDIDEGADLASAEDYELEIKFADYLPDLDLPSTAISIDYVISDREDDLANVVIDKIIYEVEIDDCVFERELEFTDQGDGSGTITISPDDDLGSVPEAFVIVFALPGVDDTEGSFSFQLSNLQASSNLLLGSPNKFNYEVLDNDVAGEWELELTSEEEFEAFKEVFAPLNPELENLSFEDITGKVTAEFEFQEMKFVIELVETEEITSCEDGETEIEIENKVVEIEAEYDAEDGEIEFEGSHPILSDEGLVEDELDFIIEGEYEVAGEEVTLNLLKVIDEDNFKDGEELFRRDEGVSFTFSKD